MFDYLLLLFRFCGQDGEAYATYLDAVDRACAREHPDYRESFHGWLFTGKGQSKEITEELEALWEEAKKQSELDARCRWLEKVKTAFIQRALSIVEQMEDELEKQTPPFSNVEAAADTVTTIRIESGDFTKSWQIKIRNLFRKVTELSQSEDFQSFAKTQKEELAEIKRKRNLRWKLKVFGIGVASVTLSLIISVIISSFDDTPARVDPCASATEEEKAKAKKHPWLCNPVETFQEKVRPLIPDYFTKEDEQ